MSVFLAVDRLADTDVARDERVLLAAGDEDALVPVRLHHDGLAALEREKEVSVRVWFCQVKGEKRLHKILGRALTWRRGLSKKFSGSFPC